MQGLPALRAVVPQKGAGCPLQGRTRTAVERAQGSRMHLSALSEELNILSHLRAIYYSAEKWAALK